MCWLSFSFFFVLYNFFTWKFEMGNFHAVVTRSTVTVLFIRCVAYIARVTAVSVVARLKLILYLFFWLCKREAFFSILNEISLWNSSFILQIATLQAHQVRTWINPAFGSDKWQTRRDLSGTEKSTSFKLVQVFVWRQTQFGNLVWLQVKSRESTRALVNGL